MTDSIGPSVVIKGDQLKLTTIDNGEEKTFMVLSVPLLLKTVKAEKERASIERNDMGEEISRNEVKNFICAFNEIAKEASGRYVRYKEDGRFWKSFVEAALTAKRMAIDYKAYIKLIIDTYIEWKGHFNIPYPSQLHGVVAEQMVINRLSRGSDLPPEIRASKKANMNKYLPLEDDKMYQAARQRIKENKFTHEDIHYMRERQMQVYGEPLPWLSKYERQLNSTGGILNGTEAEVTSE